MQLHLVIYCRISDSVLHPVESALKVYIDSTVLVKPIKIHICNKFKLSV